MSDQLFSLQVEKHLLGGILKYPDMFFEVEQVITENAFYNDIHRVIFSTIKEFISSGKSLDKVLIAQYIKDLSIQFQDNINVGEYINSLSLIQIEKLALIDAAHELDKLRVCRDISQVGNKIIKHVKTIGNRTKDDIVNDIDKIYHNTVQSSTLRDQPKILLDGIETLIEDRAKNPVQEMGLVTPHPVFNTIFGGIRNGNIYAFVSRPGHGKTTFLDDLAIHMTRLNNKAKALILDTEMDTTDIKFRIAAALTSIPPWWLETGNWKNHPIYAQAFKNNKHLLTDTEALVDHVNVAGKPIHELCAIIRRWYYKKVGKGMPSFIVYDYIKLTGEKDAGKKEYELIGEKINTLKELSLELNIPILTACQLNRAAEQGIDDSSAVSQSDRLYWFTSFLAIFRRKSLDDIDRHGENFGTHMLIPLKYRFQGRDAFGHNDMVRVQEPDGKIKYYRNFINFDVVNFSVKECGTLRDIVNNERLVIQEQNNQNENVELA